MFKFSTFIYLLSDIACASNYESSDNEGEFKHVSVKERARLINVTKKIPETPQNTVKYSWIRPEAGFRQGSKLVPNDKQASVFSQKLEARPIASKDQNVNINFKQELKSKTHQLTTSETSFTNKRKNFNLDKNSTGAIPKQLNRKSKSFKAEVHKEPKRLHKVHRYKNQQFIRTEESRYKTENQIIKDMPPQNTLDQNTFKQHSETLEPILDIPNTSSIDEIEKCEEAQRQPDSEKYKKREGGCISALFFCLDCFFG